MTSDETAHNSAISADVAELRARFPRTHDLYREVCVLLFFRYGITPTVNKLYQLVRKGSMSAPTEALNVFWKTLRERSRFTIDHAELPTGLREAAGEMVTTLWRSAQTLSNETLSALRADAIAAVELAEAKIERNDASLARMQKDFEAALGRIAAFEELVGNLREDLAAAKAIGAALEQQLEERESHALELRSQMELSNEKHRVEQDKLAERTQVAEHRFLEMEKRALLEIDRERTRCTKLQKSLEAARIEIDSERARLLSEQSRAQETISQLHHEIGSLKSAVEASKTERGREQAEAHAMRLQLDEAIRHAAVEDARAERLRLELCELKSATVKSESLHATKLGHRRKPRRRGG